jgi:hypothetical protein
MWRDGAAFTILGLLLGGCAVHKPLPTVADFPIHSSAPPFHIHWRLTLDPDVVRADGLIERRHPYIGSAWLQLVGLDTAGSVVSFTAPYGVRWKSDSDLEFFRLTLRPRGHEQRFEVRLHSFDYREEMSP